MRWWYETIKKYLAGGTPDDENMSITIGVTGKSCLSVYTDSLAANGDNYSRADGSAAAKQAYDAADPAVNTIVPFNGVVKNLRVLTTAPGVQGEEDNTAIVTLYKNGSATGLTCTVSGAATAANDTTHTVTVAAGDKLTFKVVNSEFSDATEMTLSVEYDPS